MSTSATQASPQCLQQNVKGCDVDILSQVGTPEQFPKVTLCARCFWGVVPAMLQGSTACILKSGTFSNLELNLQALVSSTFAKSSFASLCRKSRRLCQSLARARRLWASASCLGDRPTRRQTNWTPWASLDELTMFLLRGGG